MHRATAPIFAAFLRTAVERRDNAPSIVHTMNRRRGFNALGAEAVCRRTGGMLRKPRSQVIVTLSTSRAEAGTCKSCATPGSVIGHIRRMCRSERSRISTIAGCPIGKLLVRAFSRITYLRRRGSYPIDASSFAGHFAATSGGSSSR